MSYFIEFPNLSNDKEQLKKDNENIIKDLVNKLNIVEHTLRNIKDMDKNLTKKQIQLLIMEDYNFYMKKCNIFNITDKEFEHNYKFFCVDEYRQTPLYYGDDGFLKFASLWFEQLKRSIFKCLLRAKHYILETESIEDYILP